MTDTRPARLGDPRNRVVPKIPCKGEWLRVVIDSDAKNEITDGLTSDTWFPWPGPAQTAACQMVARPF